MNDGLPNLPDPLHCTGCQVCRDACPNRAIIMKADKHGFFYPEINTEKCIACKRCEKVCPVKNAPCPINEYKEAYVGVHKDKNVVSRSSSGGAFDAVLRAWKPDAVCGVRWEGFKAVNDIGYSDDEIRLFSKSKYILSDTNDIFRRATEEVKSGKRVVLSGTPCQVAAFRNYYGESDNLLLVDIVCHGAPSDMLLKMHLNELRNNKGKIIDSWSFRDKTPVNGAVSSRSARVDFADGTWEHYEIKQNAYLRLYYERVAYRPSCGNCLFAVPERVSDITVCDAHHINELYPEMSVEKGASTIIIHSEKGKRLLPAIESTMNLKSVDFEWIVEHNQQLNRPTMIHPNTDEFYRLIDAGETFEKAVAAATHKSLLSRAIGKIQRIVKG